MANIRRTATGQQIDMDMLRLANETTIAVGNMKVNARGDQLGPGGKVIKTRAQIIQDLNALNTPVADHGPVAEMAIDDTTSASPLLQPTAEHTPVAESSTTPEYVKPRGSFADSVAQQTEVKQELLTPSGLQNGLPPKGPQRF